MVELRWGDEIFESRPGESVLDTLVRGGVDVPFSCRKGSCHCCPMRATAGRPSPTSQRGLREALVESGHFKPCVCTPHENMQLAPADPSQLFVRAMLAERRPLTPELVELAFETEIHLDWRPGQFVNLRRVDDGVVRSYSVTRRHADAYYLCICVRRQTGGTMSPWLADELEVGAELEIQGPLGACAYDPSTMAPTRPLLVVASGSGVPAMLGLVEDALAAGHRGPITLAVGARSQHELDALVGDDRAFDPALVTLRRCVSTVAVDEQARAEVHHGRPTEVAFEGVDPSSVLFVCGAPRMVFEARRRAVLAGIARADIHADPFEPAQPFEPEDREKIAAIPPDPALWSALEEGRLLREILEDFYTQVYADPRLAPFFHNATKERAIDKQYSFLRDLITGARSFFGLRPFNAHHWMIISDELFDYRETLIEDCARRHGLPEAPLRRWMALHEAFRREIVKSAPRGMYMDGVERRLEGFSVEVLPIDMVCDGCTEEIQAGERGRMHRRTGQLYCDRCAGRAVG